MMKDSKIFQACKHSLGSFKISLGHDISFFVRQYLQNGRKVNVLVMQQVL